MYLYTNQINYFMEFFSHIKKVYSVQLNIHFSRNDVMLKIFKNVNYTSIDQSGT